MKTIYEVYFDNGEETQFKTVYFSSKRKALDYANKQCLSDNYTVVKYNIVKGTIIDALNRTLMQINREFILISTS